MQRCDWARDELLQLPAGYRETYAQSSHTLTSAATAIDAAGTHLSRRLQSERGIVACGDKEVTGVAGDRAGRQAGFPRLALAAETWQGAVRPGKKFDTLV